MAIKKTDWLDPSRQGQLNTARTWMSVFNEETTDEEGGTVKKYVAWGISAEILTDFGFLFAEAQEALTLAQEKETRTEVVNTRCRVAFKALVDMMRWIKRRFFHVPPLSDADIISLMLRLPDKTPTRQEAPEVEYAVETFLIGRHQLGIQLILVSGDPNDPAVKSFRVWYKVVAPGDPIPQSPEDLTKSFSTKRKKDIIDFDFEDSGKQAYFSVQAENGKKKGPWGPLVNALIP